MKHPPDRDDRYIIFALIFLLSNRLQTIGDSFFNEVSTKQWFVLVVLDVMKDYPPTLNELSQAVGSSHQNVKQLVLKLEQKGYVELYKDEEDARRLRIKPTPKSAEFNQAYHKKNNLFVQQLFSSFNETELSVTKKVMSALGDTLDRMKLDYVKE